MPRYQPSNAELSAIEAAVEKQGNPKIADNALFQALYHHKDGLFPRKGARAIWKQVDGEWIRYKRNLSRREWIERFFPIRAANGQLQPLKLNPGQRKFEAEILRMERAGVPVRVIILKARKLGFSTYVQALMFESILRGEHVRGLIVADNGDRAQLLLQIASLGRTQMEKSRDGKRSVPWDFRMTSKAAYSMVWDRPIFGEVNITSSETDAPGRGSTPSMIHMSETAFWKNAEAASASCMSALPSMPGTYAFDESTANGDVGKFRDDFKEAWAKRDIPIAERRGWQAVFFPWWQHPDYCWTRSYGLGKSLPVKLVAQIEATLTDAEEWVLKQKYLKRWDPSDEWVQVRNGECQELVIENGKIIGERRRRKASEFRWARRGVGWQQCSIDQIAWAREKLEDKEFSGDMDLFNQEFPRSVDVAFLSTGRPVFDPAMIEARLAKCAEYPPVFRGFLVVEQPTTTTGSGID